MHKLIVSFKDRIQKVFIAETAQCTIGRHADCDIQIDNLAVADVHVTVYFSQDNVTLKLHSSENPVLLNNKKTSEKSDIKIHRGDEISIGKHVISYHWENDSSDKLPSMTSEPIAHHKQNAWLQILSGPKMGRTMQLNKTRLRIGSSDTPGAMITSRQDGYYLSSLDDNSSVKVNNNNIDDTSIHLQDGNTIQVGDMEMLFFIQE